MSKSDKRKKGQRADGLYEKKITIGTKLDGTPIRKTFYARSRPQLEAKIRQYYESVGKPEVDNKILLKDWADKWLEAYKKGKVKEITYETNYRQPIEQHIKPYFKEARLAAIHPIDIENFYAAKANYSKSVLRKIMLCINGMFEAAIENHLIYENPARKKKIESKAVPVEKRAYSIEEKKRVIEFAKKHKHGAPLVIMLKAGLNRAEVLALRWSDVDFKNMLINVNRSISEVNGKIYVGEPKTEARKDAVPFDAELKEVLLSIPRRIGCDLLFPNKNGGYMSPHNWYNRNYKKFFEDYKEYCIENNIKDFEILESHELRHTFGTHVYLKTKDIHITKRLMRHADIRTTSNIYMEDGLDEKREAIEKLSED